MIVRVKLTGGLREKAPYGNQLQLTEGASIDDVLSKLDIAPPQVQIVLLDGKPQPNRSTAIQDGQEVTILAPVGGG